MVAQDINNVADFVANDAKGLRAQYCVVIEQIVQELRGLPCAELTVEPVAKQQILSIRSFGERVTDRREWFKRCQNLWLAQPISCVPRGCVASGCTC